MNDGNRKSVQDMLKLEGDAFNKSYAEFMDDDHRAAVGFFNQAYGVAINNIYKKFLERGIKIVKQHYEEAQRLPK